MWTVIIMLILIGFLLLLLEILVIPGTGFAGIVGLALMVAGIWVSYTNEGIGAGHITLSVTLAVNLVGILVALRSKTWKKATLTSEIKGKAGQNIDAAIKVGDHGITISRCAPSGTAEFDGQLLEVTTQSQFIDPRQQVEVIKVTGNQIVVKPIKH